MTANATGHAGSVPATQTWKWTSDAFAELNWLNRFGDQGWEVERIDGLARFVSRRPTSEARRWEYRREAVTFAGGRKRAARLAAEGWEPCGNWMRFFEYYKRPKAAEPARLDVLPAVPARNVYWSGRFALLVAALLLSVIAGIAVLS